MSYEISSSKLSGLSIEFFMNLYWVALKSKILGIKKEILGLVIGLEVVNVG